MIKRIVSLLCIALLLYAGCSAPRAAYAETVTGDANARLNAGLITYEGESYRPKRRLTTILFLGIDKSADDSNGQRYRNGGQADFLVLLVIDDNAKQITPIQINRDTVAEISALSSFGQDIGLWTAQICLAHSFGDGREQSCIYTMEAVSRLFCDVPIDNYAALGLDGIASFNDILGGVTVTLEDDFTAYDPAMTAGTTLTLRGVQAEYFVRMRYSVGEETNASRLIRQRVYLSGVELLLRQKISENINFVGDVFDALQPYLVTDMARGKMINMANRADSYQINGIVQIDGVTVLGESGYIEFHPDERSLMRAVLDVFYDKV